MKNIEYTITLNPEDRMRVFFQKDKGVVLRFVLQYYAMVDGKWRTIMRVDNCHGRAHKHIYHLQAREHHVELSENANIVFSEAKEYIESNFRKIKENFMFVR